MNNLIESYLETVRKNLYNKQSRSSKQIKKKKASKKQLENAKNEEGETADSKNKHVKFVNATDNGQNQTSSIGKAIEGRICTPFKATKPSSSIKQTVELSPSLSSDSGSFIVEKGIKRKRRLSFDSQGMPDNQSPRKNTIAKVNIENNATNSKSTSSAKKTKKEKSKKKLTKLKNRIEKTMDLSKNPNKVTDKISPKRNPNWKKTRTMPQTPTDEASLLADKILLKRNPNLKKTRTLPQLPTDEALLDYYDNDKVTVKGLKFERFCSLFPLVHNDLLLQKSYDGFKIPKKYFITSQNDNFDCFCNSEEAEHKGTHTFEPKRNKIKKKRKKIVILEDQVIHQRLDYNDKEGNIQSNFQEQDQSIADEIPIVNTLENGEESNAELQESYHFEESTPNITENAITTSPPEIINLKNNNKVIVLQQSNQIVHFNGLCFLEVLNGEVEILGATFKKNSGKRKVYSPRGTALLYIKNVNKLEMDTNVMLKDLVLEDLFITKTDANRQFKHHCAIIICKELKEPYINFIENHISQKIFPENELRVDFELSGSFNKTTDSEAWEDILENITKNSTIVICGGKGVGKSTFLRYSLNALLNKFPKVRVVDLDPGQSEFFPPGCVYVATVDQVVLGPNYTHLQAVDRMYLSHINIGHNVAHYLKAVKSLIESLEATENQPTLVNFPGFTQGLGLDIAAITLKLLQPSLLIEIKSKAFSKNYKIDMTCENVSDYLQTSTLLNNTEAFNDSYLSYEYVKFDSLSEKNDAWTLEARQAREICILSYFGKMMTDGVKELTSSDVSMYSINVSSLVIANFEGKSISPMAINGAVVALCSMEDSDLFRSYGYGFVRGMDLEADALVLLTPEPIEILDKVSHLVLSSITTPPSLLMAASDVKDSIPYVNVGDLVDFGQFTKRSYLPAKK